MSLPVENLLLASHSSQYNTESFKPGLQSSLSTCLFLKPVKPPVPQNSSIIRLLSVPQMATLPCSTSPAGLIFSQPVVFPTHAPNLTSSATLLAQFLQLNLRVISSRNPSLYTKSGSLVHNYSIILTLIKAITYLRALSCPQV